MAVLHSKAASWLKEQSCDELKFFDFLIEFSATFAQLGTDIALLRTKEDFKDFDYSGLKQFKEAEVFTMLQDIDFYEDVGCLLGLVEIKPAPPKFKSFGKEDGFNKILY